MRILVFGLPGSGKTSLANELALALNTSPHGTTVGRINADYVRSVYDDWDFSAEGRTRQAERMYTLSVWELRRTPTVIADFVAPTPELRAIYKPDFSIWMNTVDAGRFADTNKVWQSPTLDEYDAVVTQFNALTEAHRLWHLIRNSQPDSCLDASNHGTPVTVPSLKKS